MFKGMIFDFGGVLTKVDWGSYYGEVKRIYGVDLDKFKLVEKKLRHRLDVNDISFNNFFDLLSSEMGVEFKRDDYLNIIRRISSFDLSLIEYVRDLKDKFNLKVGVLSNNSPLFINSEVKHFLAEVFDFQLYSYEVKLKKPDSKFYALAAGEFDCEVSEILFVDDKKKNILEANRLGFDFYQYDNFDKFKEYIKLSGVDF